MYREITLATVTAAAATSNSGTVDTSFLREGAEIGRDLRLYFDFTAVTGTAPTLDITVDGVVGAGTHALGAVDEAGAADSFAQVTTTGVVDYVFHNAPKEIKVTWTIGGTTPAFTFTVTATRG